MSALRIARDMQMASSPRPWRPAWVRSPLQCLKSEKVVFILQPLRKDWGVKERSRSPWLRCTFRECLPVRWKPSLNSYAGLRFLLNRLAGQLHSWTECYKNGVKDLWERSAISTWMLVMRRFVKQGKCEMRLFWWHLGSLQRGKGRFWVFLYPSVNTKPTGKPSWRAWKTAVWTEWSL